jgi:hypothetical protein
MTENSSQWKKKKKGHKEQKDTKINQNNETNNDNILKTLLSKPLINIYEMKKDENIHKHEDGIYDGLDKEFWYDTEETLDMENIPSLENNENMDENIEAFSSNKNTKTNTTNTKTTTKTTTKLDFADIELNEELNKGNKELKEKNEKMKNDPFCGNKQQNTKQILQYVHSFFTFLKYPSIYLSYVNKKIGIYTCNVLSKNKATDDEKRVVIETINRLTSLMISIFVLYNIFFILCFQNENGQTIQTFSISKKLFEKNSILTYLFEFVIFPVTLLDGFFTKTTKTWINKLPTSMAWFVLFYAITYIIHKYGKSIMELFNNSITMFFNHNKKSTDFGKYSVTAILYPIFHTLILYGTISYYISSDYAKQMQESGYTTNMNVFIFIFIVINILLRTAISQYLVTVTGIAIGLYILSYSFFGMYIYSGAIFSTMKLIDKFVRDSVKEKEYEMCSIGIDCQQRTMFQNIMSFIQLVTNLIYKYIFIGTVIAILIYAMYDYSTLIQNSDLKTSLISLNLIIIFCILVFLYTMNLIYVSKTFTENPTTISETSNMNIPTEPSVSPSPHPPLNIPETHPLYEPMSTEVPVSNPLPQPISTEVPISNPLPQPISTEVPVSNSLYEPISTEVPVSNSLYEPISTEVPVSNSLYEPMSTEVPVSNPLPQPISTSNVFKKGGGVMKKLPRKKMI